MTPSRSISLNDIKNSPCGKLNPHLFEKEKVSGGRKVVKHWQKRSKEKDYIGWNLLYWCNERAVGLEEEYKFHPDRGWKFDWCVPALKIAVEYEGGIFMAEANKGHKSVSGILRDIEKYNAAAELGWRVIRMTPNNYKTLITELNKYLK